MYNVHLFGEGTDTFSNIFNKYNYNDSADYDFDVYVTTHFHGKPCDIRDLKTDKLIIFNNDVCHSLKNDLFPSINKFLNQSDKKIKCLVTASHYIIEELSEDFDYCYYSQTTNEISINTPTRDLPILFGRDVSHLRQKKFLSFNGRVQRDRKALYEFLRDNDFLKDGWVSYNPYGQTWRGELFPAEDSLVLDSVYYDKDNENRGMADWNMGLYMTSYFSIITETQFEFGENEDISSVNFSEKVFKAILGMHPFILLAQPKALFALRELGFKTFGDYWDEGYDDEENDDKRMERCFDSIKKFLVNDIQYIHRKLSSVDWFDSIGKILEYNFNHFFVHNNRQRKSLESKIQNLAGDRGLQRIVGSREFTDSIQPVGTHISEFNLNYTFNTRPIGVHGDWDCSTTSQYQIVADLFNEYGLDKSEWIFFTNNLREGIKWESNVKVVDPHLERVFHLLQHSDIEYDFFTIDQFKILKTHTKSHIFSCYNRFPRKHRVLCIDEILNRNIEEKGLISFVCGDDERLPGTNNLMNYIKSFGLSDKTNEYFETSPHILDLQPQEEDDNKCITFNFDDVKNTFFNLVTETFFYEKDSLFVSEKTYKFLIFHPMIILGQPYSLKHLRKSGFKTFPDMFDESYDEIEDDNERFFTVMDQVEKLCHEPYETLYERYVKCFDSILHNQEVIKKKYNL